MCVNMALAVGVNPARHSRAMSMPHTFLIYLLLVIAATDSPSQLDVSHHHRHALGVDCAQVCILEQRN